MIQRYDGDGKEGHTTTSTQLRLPTLAITAKFCNSSLQLVEVWQESAKTVYGIDPGFIERGGVFVHCFSQPLETVFNQGFGLLTIHTSFTVN